MLEGHSSIAVEPKVFHSIHEETLMAEAEIVVHVEASHLSESIQRKLDTLWVKPNETENFTMFRTLHIIRQSKKNLFEPSVISIGPFHHGHTNLQAMEEQKWRFLRDFLSRGYHISLDLCISEMKMLEERTRRCYSETVNLDSDSFVQMMLLDGCFVLECFLKQKEKRFNSIFEVGWNYAFLDSDLLLLENQIPFFVVEKLCEIGVKQEDRIHFVNDLICIMAQGPTNHPLIPNPPAQIHHLVHLYHHCSVPIPRIVLGSKSFHLTKMLRPNRIKEVLLGFLLWVLIRIFSGPTSGRISLKSQNSTGNTWPSVIPCATELHDAGIKFRPKNKPQHMLDISFDNGVLEIPTLTITDSTKPSLANLIAFEQCKYGEMSLHLTSFASLLDSLVSTEKDVIILQQCGIVENWLGSEEELAHFINQLGQGALLENNHSLAELFTEVNRYSQSSWNKQQAKFVRDYFSSPWAVISLVAALVLLVLTCVQSFFAVYAYYVPPSA